MPFDLKDWGVAQRGHLKSTCHILRGIHRNRRFWWYASGDGLPVGNWYGGGYHHRVSLSVSFPFFAVNKLLPIQYLSLSLTVFPQPWGSRRLKSCCVSHCSPFLDSRLLCTMVAELMFVNCSLSNPSILSPVLLLTLMIIEGDRLLAVSSSSGRQSLPECT